MKKILRFLISRVFWFSLLIVVQIGIFAVILFNISSYSTYLYAAFVLFSLIIVIWLVAKDDNPSYKITWIILVMALPAFGVLLYLFVQLDIGHRYANRRVQESILSTVQYVPRQTELMARRSLPLRKATPPPCWSNTPTTASSPIISAISPAFRPMAAPRWNTPLWARISSAS